MVIHLDTAIPEEILSIFSRGLRRITAIGVLILFICFMQPTVSNAGDTTISKKTENAAHSMSLAVLPIKNITAVYGENASVRSPITGKVFVTGPVKENATEILAEYILAQFAERTEYDVLPPARTQGVYEQVLSGVPVPSSDRQAVTWMGRRLGVDAVIVTHIFRFRERQGNRLSVETPASVAFDMQMILSNNGRIAWNAFADETQSALSENLFQIGKFFQRQGRWITVGEMADAAVSRIFDSLP